MVNNREVIPQVSAEQHGAGPGAPGYPATNKKLLLTADLANLSLRPTETQI
jgi:hypothetical protein